MVNITINNKSISVQEGTTILDAAKMLGIKIPTLCYFDMEDVNFKNNIASCRVCVVEVEGVNRLLPACATEVTEGMKINTSSARAVQARRHIVELLLSNHPKDCLSCTKNLNCELQTIAHDLGIRKIRFEGEMSNHPKDTDNASIMKEPNKCILCKRCKTACSNMQTVGALATIGRGFNTYVGSPFNRSMYDTTCTFCGQCVAVCPTGALVEKSSLGKIWRDLHNPNKVVVVQTAPAVRVALGEEFGYEPGTVVTGQMVNALRTLGFNYVFDTNFAADLTIMEEAGELVHRIKHGGRIPMLTSCCPSWVNFFENQFPDLLDIPSSCKSPHQMFGAMTKSYWAEKMGIDSKDIAIVSIMPCVAKKYESDRAEMADEAGQNVDYVMTTRELALMIKEAGINFNDLDTDGDFDDPMGESAGAGTIFGSAGGVLEAGLRTAYEWITGEELKEVDFNDLRGLDGTKVANIELPDRTLRVVAVSGLGNARRLLEKIRDGEEHFDVVEIMACPGGCIAGGGQPYHKGDLSILKKRSEAIYNIDRSKAIRKSHENPSIKKIYDEFLGEVYGEKAHKYLHTHYHAKPRM